MNSPPYDHDELLLMCEAHVAYLDNGLFTELQLIKTKAPVPSAAIPDQMTVPEPESVTRTEPGPGTTKNTCIENDTSSRQDETTAEMMTMPELLVGTTNNDNIERVLETSMLPDYTPPVSTSPAILDSVPTNVHACSPGTTTVAHQTVVTSDSISCKIAAANTTNKVDTVVVGSIKSDPTIINILLSENTSSSSSGNSIQRRSSGRWARGP